MKRFAALIDRLLGAGANVNHKDTKGMTALMRAAEGGHVAVAPAVANGNGQATRRRQGGGVHHQAALGMALGLTAHAVGTARALQESEECGAFAALAMSLMGVFTAVLLPLAILLWL